MDTILKANNFYLVGIKGGGMTALALLLQGLGKKISGSDTAEKFFTDQVLHEHQIKFIERFDPKIITKKIDVVIYSTAYSLDNNEQLKKARQLKIPILSYPQALGEIIHNKRTVAVAGTHGKTTVTAMLGYILHRANLDPSVMVGSNVSQFNGNTLVGKSDLLVVETDEYQNKFKYYQPWALVLNNVDWDHPDFFSSAADYYQAFLDYVKKVPATGWLVANIDDVNVAKLIKMARCQVITHSLSQTANWQAKDFRQDFAWQYCKIYKQAELWAEVKLRLFGEFNIRNALAAVAAAEKLAVNKQVIISSLADFFGTKRRFEIKGKYRGCLIVDDFAHHPAEIQATLKMVRQRFVDKKIYAVFHPHTYTRTDKFRDGFSVSFKDCDEVIVLDIYASARETKGDVSSQDLIKLINNHSHNATYLPNIDKAVDYLRNKLGPDSVLITMGAGDVWRVGEKLIENN